MDAACKIVGVYVDVSKYTPCLRRQKSVGHSMLDTAYACWAQLIHVGHSRCMLDTADACWTQHACWTWLAHVGHGMFVLQTWRAFVSFGYSMVILCQYAYGCSMHVYTHGMYAYGSGMQMLDTCWTWHVCLWTECAFVGQHLCITECMLMVTACMFMDAVCICWTRHVVFERVGVYETDPEPYEA